MRSFTVTAAPCADKSCRRRSCQPWRCNDGLPQSGQIPNPSPTAEIWPRTCSAPKIRTPAPGALLDFLSTKPSYRLTPLPIKAATGIEAEPFKFNSAHAHSMHGEPALRGSPRDDFAALVQSLDGPDIAVNRASRRARSNVINRTLGHASAAIIRNGAAAMPKVRRIFVAHHEAQAFRSFWYVADREGRRSFATSTDARP
jgi:hypothetical protein